MQQGSTPPDSSPARSSYAAAPSLSTPGSPRSRPQERLAERRSSPGRRHSRCVAERSLPLSSRRMKRKIVRILDSYASLLVLLLANFFLLELVDDPRWGAVGSTLLSAAALVVAISDPDAGHRVKRRHAIQILACVALAPLVLVVNSAEVLALTYLLPVVLLVTATL